MSYSIKFDEISAAQQSTQTTISAWGDGMMSIQTALSALIGDSRLQGQTASSIKSYLSEVHGTLLQTLQSLMNDYSASLLLYKDGYYQIDSNSHAQLPGQVFKTLQSELRLSQAHLKDQLELLQNARAKVSDLVHYSGVSHAKTVVDYSELITDINRLDEAIMQYESNHARQDLAAFKELLASTRALIAEYSSKPKRAGSYQVGDIGQLNTIKRFATAYQGVARHLETNAKRLQAAQERDQARFEAVAAEDRASQGWVDLALSLVTIAVGVAAIVMTAGAATPLVVGAFVAGSGTVAYGASNLYEAGHNIYLGSVGDGVTVATNPLRDTLFMGNDRLYHQIGGLFTTASAALIPIGQTKSVAKGLTEFTIGEIGGFIGGQASYHGTKLLGGSEQDAQRATLVGNILGGIAASSAARRFSLNEPIAARVTKSAYNRQQLLKNLENSRLARESSRFDDYLRREYRLKGRYFAERTTISNGKIGYLSSDYFEGKQIPVRSRAFVDEAGHIKWPNADGFMVDNLGNPITEQVTLKAGQIIDRYGSSSGRFTSPIENGVTLPFNKRGLPYPEGYQDYHKYELVMDLTKKNIVNAYYQSEEIIRKQISVEMKKWNLSFDDLANIQKGEIAKVFGQGGGIQIKFPTGVGIYKKMGLLKEIN
ncbi:membrane protein [Streptococcus equi subsp. zooepidemicus Sz35]|nr:membrane protein [Streptococcus equi subsp. zooepidemicus Sz35]HEL0659481.1 glycohydrolase toxin TNT-related protein [Streptococcus equi subsp. zooepidemicus]HEL0754913.1 glycohydrolase toxin TNT-related protein [Streptococcus equi subsp. zooepidemicus]